ncbi:MAG: hypothetical protein IPG66_16890 [Hydrogenophilales bacterium]|nr:hypothetical protein [Hydrogenophilales bacterium]
MRILPAGLFRAQDGRPLGLPGWRIDSQSAKSVVDSKPNGATDFMIDYEHQSINTVQNGKPVPAAGWFKRIEWRDEDGLYMVDIRWTEKARQMIADQEYRHVSPVFGFDGKTGVVTHIVSVALTNAPALAGLTDLAAATASMAHAYNAAQSFTPEDRARFMKWFDFDPMAGQPWPPGYDQGGFQDVTPPTPAQLAAMTEKDRNLYIRVFGDVFEALGKPLKTQ